MGSAFDTGGLDANFTGVGKQHALFGPLSALFLSQIQSAVPQLADISNQIQGLIPQLTADTSAESKALSERIFEDALLQPSLAAFHRDIAPQIGESFAGIGGTLSSRRGQAFSDALSDLHTNAQASLAAQLPTIQNFPLQQTLSQIGGLGALQGATLAPLSQALQFALTPTRSFNQTPPGVGFGLLGDLLGAGATLGGASILGKGSNPGDPLLNAGTYM